MGRRRTAAPALLACALALVLPALALWGCGSSAKPRLTRAQLTSRANAICRKVSSKLQAATGGKSISTPQQVHSLAAKLSDFEQTSLAELGELVPPPALEADWKRFVAGAQALAENTAKLSEQSSVAGPATQRLLASSEATQKQMVAIAKRTGLTDCEQVA